MPIAAATHVTESRVIQGSVARVWELVRPFNLKWLSTVKKVEIQGGLKEEDLFASRIVHYVDGTIQTLRLLEISDLSHYITYEVTASEPPISVTSALHTIRLRHVTHDNSTLIEWSSDYSSDAGLEVVQDSKFKKQEGFQDLLSALGKQ